MRLSEVIEILAIAIRENGDVTLQDLSAIVNKSDDDDVDFEITSREPREKNSWYHNAHGELDLESPRVKEEMLKDIASGTYR